MKPGDLFITLPDHAQRDSDHFNPNEILVFIRAETDPDEHGVTHYYFTARDRIGNDKNTKYVKDQENSENYLTKKHFIPYVDPNYIPPKARSRFELIDI